jgi:DNA-damage-inducible protein J
MATTSITIRMDETLKKQAEALFEDIGMNMTTAFTIFARTAVRQNKIPFEVAGDPFHSAANQARVRDAIRGLESGQGGVRKTLSELETLEND